MPKPHEHPDECRKDQRENPIARYVTLDQRRGIGTHVASASNAASLTSRFEKTRCASSCSSSASKKFNASDKPAPCSGVFCFARTPRNASEIFNPAFCSS